MFFLYFCNIKIKEKQMGNRFKNNDRSIIIAGPCSVESKLQLTESVESLQRVEGISMIRCGVWKPRTRPGGFEGIGEPALEWMEEISQKFPKTPFCCEVARPEHVEMCQNHGIDTVWIGARTSGDPFSVEELAEALKGSQMSVMVKNPLTPDVKLWVGAIERIMKSGIENIAAIHRGFFVYHSNTPYRNTPLWEVPIELRRLMPDIPILCDPSHIGGKREYIQTLMQTASNMGTDGYMVEVHPHPDEALTDKEQQITADTLATLLENIVRRKQTGSENSELETLRKEIDLIDHLLLAKLSERMHVSEEIARIKSNCNLSVFQPKRWDEVLRQRTTMATELGLHEDFVKSIYERIHTESVRIQESILEQITDNNTK